MRIRARIPRHTLAIAEGEHSIRVHAPAPHRRIRIVFFASVTGLAARLAWDLVLATLNSTSDWRWLYPLLALPELYIAWFCLLLLYNELATTNLTFERNTIEFNRRLLGIRVDHRWFAIDDMRGVGPTYHSPHPITPGYLYLRRRNSKVSVLLRAINPASIGNLCAALERRGWTYGNDLPD